MITGAASGTGRATALIRAREGAKVVGGDMFAEAGRAVVDEIEAEGGDGTFVEADMSKSVDIERLMSEIVDQYGRLDCAHNNAGVEGPSPPLHEYSESEWDYVLSINLEVCSCA